MKNKWLFFTAAGLQVCTFFTMAALSGTGFVKDLAHKETYNLVFLAVTTIVFFTMALFPLLCIFQLQKYPVIVRSKLFTAFFRINMALYFLWTMAMVVLAAMCIGALFPIDKNSGRGEITDSPFLNSFIILIAISMLYLLSAIVKLRTLVKNKLKEEEARQINSIGKTER